MTAGDAGGITGDAVITEAELERRLLDFTRTKLVGPEADDSVTLDTRLFEERIVDSLKILELIAFVEAQVGRKIPDAQVVLANFRTIRVMATVFAGAAQPALVRRRSKPRDARPLQHVSPFAESASGPSRHENGVTTPPAKIFDHWTGRSQFHADAIAEMVRRGEIEFVGAGAGAGGIRFHESALALSRCFDTVAREWAAELGAEETDSPDAIALETLSRAGFVEAFPQKLVAGTDAGTARSPAVCYHSYPRLEGRTVEDQGTLTTAIGRCFREERDDDHPMERLRAFTMREIIVVGGAPAVARLRNEMIERVSSWVRALGLDGFIETATDPFFTSETSVSANKSSGSTSGTRNHTSDTRGRMLAQQILPLKYELRLGVDGAGRTVAAASFNDHQQHFARAFDIRLTGGEPAHSGCVAFGWERWVLAFVSQHGPDEQNWPDAARSAHASVS